MFRRSIPNAITCCNLLSGCLACIFAFSSFQMFGGLYGYQWVWILIGAAAVFDFCDGLSARLLHAPSAIGKELDSLSDLVSFGLAPALLLYNILEVWGGSVWLPYVSLAIPVMGALRLAKFNVDDSQATVFKGLPIPANAIFWIGSTAWLAGRIFLYGDPYQYIIEFQRSVLAEIIMACVIVAVSLSMVTNMKMFSLKLKNFSLRDNVYRYLLIIFTIAFIWVFGIPGFALTIALYFLLSAVAKG